ncbi:protein NYNRIN-like [Cucumis melo var. makuwa]|uniref:Protein NYNRIN-like n=1 Tax=Cucumis melo var. makuwa TaxID=1194695 RepID=A0A5D3D6P8_CUCMM|nr:protein NYNRIN-like [Cucumis melo var. makuwa]TYK19173.1 protein NYNRIN-like [Cucumis melo var. makuwa]
MVQDSIDYAKKCEACRYHENFIHQPLEPLHPIVTSWPFEAWGLDLVRDLVLAVRRLIITTRHTGNKFTPKWDGPYIVKEVYTNGAYKIVDQEGLKFGPINDWGLHQCSTDFEDCTVTFPCPSSKVSSMHPHIQARRLHQHFLIFKLESFIDASSYSSSKASSTLSHI